MLTQYAWKRIPRACIMHTLKNTLYTVGILYKQHIHTIYMCLHAIPTCTKNACSRRYSLCGSTYGYLFWIVFPVFLNGLLKGFRFCMQVGGWPECAVAVPSSDNANSKRGKRSSKLNSPKYRINEFISSEYAYPSSNPFKYYEANRHSCAATPGKKCRKNTTGPQHQLLLLLLQEQRPALLLDLLQQQQQLLQ